MAVFNNIDKDVLKEVGNIGSGHASVAMSLLTNQKTHISHTKTAVSTPLATIRKELKEGDAPSVVHVGIDGDLTGEAFLIFFDDTSENIIRILKTKRMGYTQPLDDSILTEFANILIGSYLNALSNLINLIMKPTVPDLHREDMSDLMKAAGKEKTVTIRTEVLIKEENIQAALVFAFTKDSTDRILSRTKLKNILVIDEKTGERITNIFSNFGNVKVYSTGDPEEALDIFYDHLPHICFVPDTHAGLIKKLKKGRHKPHIVLMSAKKITNPYLKKLGAHDFLKKPFKKDQVISFIDG